MPAPHSFASKSPFEKRESSEGNNSRQDSRNETKTKNQNLIEQNNNNNTDLQNNHNGINGDHKVDLSSISQDSLDSFDTLDGPNTNKVGMQLVKCINTQTTRENVYEISSSVASHSHVSLRWQKPPRNILVVFKPQDLDVRQSFEELATWLQDVRECSIFVETSVFQDYQSKFRNLYCFTSENTKSFYKVEDLIDLTICLGGDGTVLYATQMFPRAVPPIVAFKMGSMGFMTNFDFRNFREHLDHVFRGEVSITLRTRLKCKIERKNAPDNDKNRYHVLNEIVIDRGPAPFLTNLEVFWSRTQVTTVQGDGLIIATPTGSTAYSMSAGGSMVHPAVPGILLTPICPHSLSFRPMILPDSATIRITVSEKSRCGASVSFDGHDRQQLEYGDSLVIATSIWPVPAVCRSEPAEEWLRGLSMCLNFNFREQQKEFE
eukprot:gb/GECH01001658.1/.p1 GENE.gb/GECH01001658.1/~~gb/GECH01001658.1/.p1  ORF type:complete len:433 (+),score=104.84 gb/GECH01001658.1/:1-1299(+)